MATEKKASNAYILNNCKPSISPDDANDFRFCSFTMAYTSLFNYVPDGDLEPGIKEAIKSADKLSDGVKVSKSTTEIVEECNTCYKMTLDFINTHSVYGSADQYCGLKDFIEYLRRINGGSDAKFDDIKGLKSGMA